MLMVFSFLCLTEDDVQKIVSVCVDGKEAQMVFIDHAHSDMAVSTLSRKKKNQGLNLPHSAFVSFHAYFLNEHFLRTNAMINSLLG